MNILVVGDDTKGAFQMRGIQLGGAIGARVTVTPQPSDWAWAERVVLVKRAAVRWRAEARRVQVPVVWDVLDFWAQPEDNGLSPDEMIAKVKAIHQAAGVTTLIGATRAMAQDIGGIYLPHHCRLGLSPGPIRDRAEVVGYDGTPKYLGRWRPALERSCAALGLRFVINPPDIRYADVLVSFRDGRWDGWACRQWKSGVKQVNAIVAGRPMVCQTSAAWDDFRAVGGCFDNTDALTEMIRQSVLPEIRAEAYEYSQSGDPERPPVKNYAATHQLPAVARQYADILRRSVEKAA